MIQRNEPLTSKDFSKGLVTRSDIINNDPNKSPNCMDIKWFFDGAIGKRLGASSTNSVSMGTSATAGWTIDSGGTLSTSLQDYWKLDEASGTRFDSFGTVNLADINSTGSIVGIRNQAALLVATASNMLLGNNATSLQTGNINFSMSSWVYLNSTSLTLERSVVSKRDPEVDLTTVLLLHCDGVDGSPSFPDASASAKTVTANGNAQVDTAQQKFGTGSVLFDGTGDYLTIPDSADWDFGTGDFTIDFWVRWNIVGTAVLIDRNASAVFLTYYDGSNLQWYVSTALIISQAWAPVINTWYHIAIVRSSGNVTQYINGTALGSAVSSATDLQGTTGIGIGLYSTGGGTAFNGWMDEIRISKGIARWTSNFTPPIRAYQVFDYEYWLYINTNQQATFRVSSTGSNQTATVQASSIGVLNTATWYNLIAWHSNNSHIGISVNLSTNTAPYTTGLRIGSAPFILGAMSDSLQSFATTHLDARQDETGFWKKVLSLQERRDLYGGGTGNTFTGSSAFSALSWAMFDFGASSIRWLTVSQGTGILASSNLGTTFVNIATTRTATYQYLDRSKNVLIATSDAYDVPLYWAGSVNTFAQTLAPNSAPGAKYSINYNGFLILLNTQDSNGTLRKRSFYYADENLQLTSSWTNSFDFPSSADDEVTAVFILYKFLYVSTRYRIFRVAFVGGNPDWSFLKVKDWGFVPRTAKLMTIKGSQVVVGMDFQRRLRVFDGFEDFFISDNIENDNKYCDFSMSKVSYFGSGLIVSHAEVDTIEQEYRINLAIGAMSSQTTHAILLNGRTLAMFPYANQGYQVMAIAESNNQLHLMAADRSGFVHILNSGNTDIGVPINEVFDSPLLYRNSPTQVNQAQQLNLYFSLGSYGTIYQRERMDFSNVFSGMRPITDKDGNAEIKGTEQSLQVLRTVDVPATYNTYQFQLTTSAGTANPWKLTRFEHIQNVKGMGQGA